MRCDLYVGFGRLFFCLVSSAVNLVYLCYTRIGGRLAQRGCTTYIAVDCEIPLPINPSLVQTNYKTSI